MNFQGNHKYLLKYKKLSQFAIKPLKIISESAGYDLSSAYHYSIEPKKSERILTDLALQIPDGFCGIISGRSGISNEFVTGILGGKPFI